MNTIGNRLRFYLEIKKAIAVLGSVDYSVITGGFVQDDEKAGDIDIITVLPYVALNRKKVLEFAKKHILAQLKNSFFPDFDFPTDILSKQQMVDAVNGRSLEVVKGNLKLKEYSKEEIINNPEADYRVWMYEMITHDFDIIAGSLESLVKDTITALKTVFLYTASLYGYEGNIPIEQIRKDLFVSANLSYKLGEKQSRYLLMMLEERKLGRVKNKDVLVLNPKNISREIEKLKNLIRNGTVFKAQHAVSWGLLRKNVKTLKEHTIWKRKE
ncbi:MAG: hypothetical protein V1868_01140 [Patescibacteria group bacterium]